MIVHNFYPRHDLSLSNINILPLFHPSGTAITHQLFMLNFFRRIRQKLITEGHLPKYLLYAVGEIALVMIGILLALQVNNHNEKLKSIRQEKVVLKSVLSDLESNAELIEKSRSAYLYHQDTGNTWIRMMAPDTTNVQRSNLIDSLLFWGPAYEVFDFTNSSIDVVAGGSDFDLIRSSEIKKQLIAYPLHIVKYKDAENEIRRIAIEKIRPRGETYISIREMYDGHSPFSSDYTGLLNDRQLNNDYVNRNWLIADILDYLDQLEDANRMLIALIKEALHLHS